MGGRGRKGKEREERKKEGNKRREEREEGRREKRQRGSNKMKAKSYTIRGILLKTSNNSRLIFS